MQKRDFFLAVTLVLIYLMTLYLQVPRIFRYHIDQRTVDRYYHSQDITHEVAGRVFVSDSEGNTALSYLYGYGEDPVKYNFQHPPFLKYIFSFSTRLTGNPYFSQIVLGMLLIVMVYLFGKKLHSRALGILASLFLIVDPLMISMSSQILLDLGQSALIMLYLYLILYHRKSWLAQGMVLGVLAASKFWAGPLFFVGLVHVYLLYKRKLDLKNVALQLLTAFATFNVVYIRSYLSSGGHFNIIFFELKSLKYWFHHSVSSFPGASLILFTSGSMKKWWGDFAWVTAGVWTPIWPLLLFISTSYAALKSYQIKINELVLLSWIPLLYLMYLGVQAPFERYFILILPYLYLTVSYLLYRYLFLFARSLNKKNEENKK